MYTVEQKYLLKLGGAGDPAASQSVEIPLKIDEVSQYLVAWVYTPGGIGLGAGNVQIKRNGAVVSTTAFAGNSLPVPLNLYTVGADFEMELMHPQTTISRQLRSVWQYDAVADAMVEDTNVSRYGNPRPMPISALITNTDAVKKDLVLLWVALVWRNV